MNRENNYGRVTIPTDLDVIEETLKVAEYWGADAIRDCDGTEFPSELKKMGAKAYATYYTTRKNNTWAKENPDEIQQCYIMTGFHTAFETELTIPLMKGISSELMQINDRDDIARWWEVIDRTTGEVLSASEWFYSKDQLSVVIKSANQYHEYTVSFLAYIIWDPVHMYNAVVNQWKDFEHQITFDVRQPKTKEFTMKRLREYLKEHKDIDVIRFTTFFHQFTLIFDELKREKYVDWYGYSASVSPYILEKFEKEVNYPFRAEYIIDQGYYNNQYRVPSKEYKDFMAFQRREVAKLAKEMVGITHEYGKEAMMFLGDHWIGTEPYMEEFTSIGLDAVVGSVGNGSTLRLISDIQGVRYTEGRFLPYFFPDTFHEGGDPVKEAQYNWVTARRAILRNPVDRIGYGGYLKLALDFPEFIEYVKTVCDEFRMIYDMVKNSVPFCAKSVAVLNCWGKQRSWGCHMVHHALYQMQNYSYAGVIEALSGMAVSVEFISFDDILNDSSVLDEIDVIINIGNGDTAHSGGDYWKDKKVLERVRSFIAEGGGFIGVGEPSACQYQGHYFQLAEALGVEMERGFTLGYDKYNWTEAHSHFIMEDVEKKIDFGYGGHNVFALENTTVLVQREKEVQLAVNEYGKGRCVYISGLPYNVQNARLLYRSIIWSAHGEKNLHQWYCDNCCVEVHAYIDNGTYCIANNTFESQKAKIYREDGSNFSVELAASEIRWYTIDK